MRWSITFYNSKVEVQTMGLPPGILANFLHISEMIEELGPNIGKPYIGSLSSGFTKFAPKVEKE
jgi:hypothetical protein